MINFGPPAPRSGFIGNNVGDYCACGCLRGATHVGYYHTIDGILVAPAVYTQASELYERDRRAERARDLAKLRKHALANAETAALAVAPVRPRAPARGHEHRPSQRRPHGQGQARR